MRHGPGGEVVLLVDADGLPPAVPLVVVEEPAVLGARHVVVPLRLGGRSCGREAQGGEGKFGEGRGTRPPWSWIDLFLRGRPVDGGAPPGY